MLTMLILYWGSTFLNKEKSRQRKKLTKVSYDLITLSQQFNSLKQQKKQDK